MCRPPFRGSSHDRRGVRQQRVPVPTRFERSHGSLAFVLACAVWLVAPVAEAEIPDELLDLPVVGVVYVGAELADPAETRGLVVPAAARKVAGARTRAGSG